MTSAIVIVAIVALLVAASIVQSTTLAMIEMIRGLVAEVFVNVGRLLVLGALITFLIVMLLL